MRTLELRPAGGGMPPPTLGPGASAAVWYRDWVCVGVDAQIPAPGDLLPVTLGDLGLHVQREADGSLRAGFNALQHGSCWTVPAQCRAGHKIRCPYVSCAFSLDSDAITAEGGAPAPTMRQFTGGSPGRLRGVPIATLGPLLFVSLGGAAAPALCDQVGSALARSGTDLDDLTYLTRLTVGVDCRWDEAPALVEQALGRPGDARAPLQAPPAGPPAARTGLLPPNVVLATLADHVAVLVLKPAGPDRCQAMVALFAPADSGGPAPDERALAALRGRWRHALGA